MMLLRKRLGVSRLRIFPSASSSLSSAYCFLPSAFCPLLTAFCVLLTAFSAARGVSPSAEPAQTPEKNVALDTSKAEAAARAGQFYVAAEEYEKLVALQPGSAELWSDLGSVLALAGNCQRALPALGKARTLNPSLFAPWYFSGVCHMQGHEDRQALRELQQAVKLNPRDSNAWYSLALAAGNLGQPAVAFDAAVRVLSLDPKRPEAYYAAGKSALDLAIECYARLHPGPAADPYIQRLEGERDAAQGVQVPAVAAFQKAIHFDPQAPDVHYALGLTWQRSGNLGEAEAEFRACLKVLPNSTLARLALAEVLAREQKPEEAKSVFDLVSLPTLEGKEEVEKYLSCARFLGIPQAEGAAKRLAAAEHAKNSPDPHRTVTGSTAGNAGEVSGDSLAQSGDEVQPQPDSPFLAAVALGVRFILNCDPRNGNIVAATFGSPSQYREFRSAFLRDDLVKLGMLLAARSHSLPSEPREAYVLGEFFQWAAFRYYDILGRQFPDSEPAQMAAAENLSSNGEQDRALEIYQALLERNGASLPVLRAVAQIYWTERNWDEALKVLRDLAQKDPRDPTLFVNIGRIYSLRGDWPNAQQNFQRAAEIDSGRFAAHLGLGETFRRLGNEEAALRELQTAIRLDPENPRPHYILSQIYRKQAKAELAQKEMQLFQHLETLDVEVRARKERLLVPAN